MEFLVILVTAIILYRRPEPIPKAPVRINPEFKRDTEAFLVRYNRICERCDIQ